MTATHTTPAPADFFARTHEGQQIMAHLTGLSQLIHDIRSARYTELPDLLEHRHGKFVLDNRLEIHFKALSADTEYAEAVVHYLSECAARLQTLAHRLAHRPDLRIDRFVRAFNDNGWTIIGILANSTIHLVSTYGYLPRTVTIYQLETENPQM